MFDSTAPGLPDPALQLLADSYWHLVRTLRLALPPPPGDFPEDLARRDRAAIARVAALAPANAVEADLAAQFVAASEQWKDCLRLAQEPETTPEWAAKCRTQALAMMRQANSALRLLLRLQDRRGKLEADNPARDRAAWTEHCALSLMAEALAPQPQPAPPVPATEPIAEPAPAPDARSRAAGEGRPRRTPGEGLDPNLVAAAEPYAAPPWSRSTERPKPAPQGELSHNTSLETRFRCNETAARFGSRRLPEQGSGSSAPTP